MCRNLGARNHSADAFATPHALSPRRLVRFQLLPLSVRTASDFDVDISGPHCLMEWHWCAARTVSDAHRLTLPAGFRRSCALSTKHYSTRGLSHGRYSDLYLQLTLPVAVRAQTMRILSYQSRVRLGALPAELFVGFLYAFGPLSA